MEDSKISRTLVHPPNGAAKSHWDEKTYAIARRLMRGIPFIKEQDREDIIQDVALRFQSDLPAWRGEAQFSTWLRSILFNHAVDVVRKRDKLRWDEESRPAIVDLDAATPTRYDAIPMDPGRFKALAEKLKDESYKKEGHDLEIVSCYYFAPEQLGPEEKSYAEKHLAHCKECNALLEKFNSIAVAKTILTRKDWMLLQMEVAMDSMQEVLDLQRQLNEKKDEAIQALLRQREEIDHQLSELGYLGTTPKKGQKACSKCGKPGHNAKTCTEPKKHANDKKEHK